MKNIDFRLEDGELPEREEIYVEYEKRDEYDFNQHQYVGLVKFKENMKYDNAIHQVHDDDVIQEMRNNYIMATLILVPKELEEEFRESLL
jgi:hypothetical protein